MPLLAYNTTHTHPLQQTMICQRCLLRAARRNISIRTTSNTRNLTQSSPFRAEAVTSETTTTTNPRPNDLPAATSTPSAAQPFSTPLSPAPRDHEDDPDSPSRAAAEVKKRQRTPSSVPAGTVLKGLNFMKNRQDPVALEDGEYPDWLWEVLRGQQEGAGAGAEGEGDLFCRFLFLASAPLSPSAENGLWRASVRGGMKLTDD